MADVRGLIHELLSGRFPTISGTSVLYRAWQEAVLSDPELTRKQREIHVWTTNRVMTVFQLSATTARGAGGSGRSRVGAGDGQLLLEPACASRAHARGGVESVD